MQAVFLTLHVFDDDVVDVAETGAVFEHLPGRVRVEVDLDEILVAHGEQAVARDVGEDVVVDRVLIEAVTLDEQLGVKTEFDMVGFRTPDDVVYLADCLSSRETLEKYQIGFLYDVAAYLNTLETVKTLRARAFVPAHAAVTEDIAPLAQYNIDKVLEIADIITELCRTPQTFESVLQQLFRRFDLVMDFEQYALVGSTVRSYLAWGKDTGRLQVAFDDHRLLWQRA